MLELGVFSIFLENDLQKFDKIPGLKVFFFFLRQEKTSKDSKQRFFIYFRSFSLFA